MWLPFGPAGYRALARSSDAATIAPVARGILTLLVVLGGFVSITSSGRLVLGHLVWTIVFWCFVPALQTAAVAIAGRIAAPERATLRTVALYHAGHGPWLVWLLAVSGLCVLAPGLFRVEHLRILFALIGGSMLIALGWGGVLTYALFRAALELPRRRAALGTALFYAAYVGAIVGYYLATNQIQPQLGFASR